MLVLEFSLEALNLPFLHTHSENVSKIALNALKLRKFETLNIK